MPAGASEILSDRTADALAARFPPYEGQENHGRLPRADGRRSGGRPAAQERERRKIEVALGTGPRRECWGDAGDGHISARDPERRYFFWLLR